MDTLINQPPPAPRKRPNMHADLGVMLCAPLGLVLATLVAAVEFPDTAVGTPCWNLWRWAVEPNLQRDLDRVERSSDVVRERLTELEREEQALTEKIDGAKEIYAMPAIFNRDYDERDFARLVTEREACRAEAQRQRAVLSALDAARADLTRKVADQKLAAARREARLFQPQH